MSRMLFEFHQRQNVEKPHSVHATYLVYGEKASSHRPDVEDVEMTGSSDSVDSDALTELARTFTLTLVQEDKLEGKGSLVQMNRQSTHLPLTYN
jgi:DNA polymerase delta subunit 3